MKHVRVFLLGLLALAAQLVTGGMNTTAIALSLAALNSNAAIDSGDDDRPQVTTDGVGNWVAVWASTEDLLDPGMGPIGTDRDVLVSRSTDNGFTWTDPAALNSNAAIDSGDDSLPQVTTDGVGNWVAVWVSTEDLLDPGLGPIGTDRDVLVSRSTDNGATWTDAVALNSNAAIDSGSVDSPELTTDGGGNWVAVWASTDSLGDTIGTDWDVLVSRAATELGWPWAWSYPVALNSNAAIDSDADEEPQVTTDGGTNWVAIWGSSDPLCAPLPEPCEGGLGGGADYDILVSRSTNNGVDWTPPVALNTNAAIDSRPDLSPRLATDAGGNWVAVWDSQDELCAPLPPGCPESLFTERDILVSRSATETGWPWTWTDPVPLNTNAQDDSVDNNVGVDGPAQVTTDGVGNWVAVWDSNGSLKGTIGPDYDVLVSRSTDNGFTWTDPAALNSNAAIDSGDDSLPQVTTDGVGNWVVVWRSDESLFDPSLGGIIGTDYDILYINCLAVLDADCDVIPPCGNGMIDSGEQCDDGDLTPGDGCDEFCQTEEFFCCNSMNTCNRDSACPDPGDACCMRHCDTGTTPPVCDGLGDPCATDPDCGLGGICCGVCGNGMLGDGEECDLGPDNGAPDCLCSSTCTIPGRCTDTGACCEDNAACLPGGTCCGDGATAPPEECDDGNLINGDCCSDQCLTEATCVPACPGFRGPNILAATVKRKAQFWDKDEDPQDLIERYKSKGDFNFFAGQVRRFDPERQPVRITYAQNDGSGGRVLLVDPGAILPGECSVLPLGAPCFPRKGRVGRFRWNFFDKEELVELGVRKLQFKQKDNKIQYRALGRKAEMVAPVVEVGPNQSLIRQDITVGPFCATVLLGCEEFQNKKGTKTKWKCVPQ